MTEVNRHRARGRPAAYLAGAAAWALIPFEAAAETPEAVASQTVEFWAAGVVALFLLIVALYYRIHMVSAESRAEALQAETAHQRDLLSRAPTQYIRWDQEGSAREVSPGLPEMLGMARGAELDFAGLARQFDAGNRAALEGAVAALREAGSEFELALKTRDGHRTLRLTGTTDPAGAVLWIADETVPAGMLEHARAQAEGLRQLLDLLPIPVWRRGDDLKLNFVNRAYVEAVEHDDGTAPETLPEIAAGAVAMQGRALAEKARATGTTQSLEDHIVIAGARRLVEFSEARLGDIIAGYAFDRTEIEEVKADLSRHIAGHEEILHNLGTAIAIYGADERLKFFNNAFVRLWRLDEQWLKTEPTLGEILENLRDHRRLPETANFPLFKSEQRKLFTSLLDPVEELVHLPDDTTLRSLITPHPFGGLLFTWEDVTDALAMERSFNTLNAVQQETLDNLYEGVAVIGANGRLTLSNPVFGRMWQIPPEQLIGEPHISDLVERMRPLIGNGEGGDWADQKEQIIGLLTDRAGHSGRIERLDGSVVDYATVPLPDGAMLLSYIDVSDSIQVERALRERNEALETADRLKAEFIANVSYELRTPLNTIIGFAEILTGQYFGDLNERQSEYSRGILDSSHQLLGLINDILDLATIEAGHMSLELATVDLHDLLSGVVSLIRERMRKKKLALEFDCPPDIGTIESDERRLKQAMFNILSNSVKFTPENGTVRLSARRTDDRIILTFADDGIGINEEDQPRVFMRFERGSNAEARRSGAGLGLSLVKSLIELHGGSVDLESQPGRGTTVTCSLPTRKIAETSESPPPNGGQQPLVAMSSDGQYKTGDELGK